MEADARDRQREKEEIDEIRRRLLEEGHPNLEEQMAKVSSDTFFVTNAREPPASISLCRGIYKCETMITYSLNFTSLVSETVYLHDFNRLAVDGCIYLAIFTCLDSESFS